MVTRLPVWCSNIPAGDHTRQSSYLDMEEGNVERLDILGKSVKMSTRLTVKFYT